MSDKEPIGYKKPPQKGQFKRGQSGNPRGRPKGTRNLKTDLESLMSTRTTILENGKARAISRQEAILLALYASAAKGNAKAAMDLLKMCIALGEPQDERPQRKHLSQDDIEIMKLFIEHTRKSKPES